MGEGGGGAANFGIFFGDLKTWPDFKYCSQELLGAASSSILHYTKLYISYYTTVYYTIVQSRAV